MRNRKLDGTAYALAMGEKLEASMKLDPDLPWKERVEKADREVQAEHAAKFKKD